MNKKNSIRLILFISSFSVVSVALLTNHIGLAIKAVNLIYLLIFIFICFNIKNG